MGNPPFSTLTFDCIYISFYLYMNRWLQEVFKNILTDYMSRFLLILGESFAQNPENSHIYTTFSNIICRSTTGSWIWMFASLSAGLVGLSWHMCMYLVWIFGWIVDKWVIIKILANCFFFLFFLIQQSIHKCSRVDESQQTKKKNKQNYK